MKRLAVFVSGRGSNMKAIMSACQDGILKGLAEVAFVFADKEVAATRYARENGYSTAVLEPKDFDQRADWMRAIAVQCSMRQIDLICCAGFMRKIIEPLLSEFANRIINVHPAWLPNYPGAHAIENALAAGEQKTGVTFHYITPNDPKGDDGQVVYDSGPMIHQVEVPILQGDTADTLKARIQIEEHRLYPQVIRAHLRGEYAITPEHKVIQTRQR